MALFTDQPGDEGLPGRERGLAMAAVMTMTTMAVFDGSMVNIALPQIARTLDVSAGATVWVSNGYLLSAAMTLAIFAALATRIGFRSLENRLSPIDYDHYIERQLEPVADGILPFLHDDFATLITGQMGLF